MKRDINNLIEAPLQHFWFLQSNLHMVHHDMLTRSGMSMGSPYTSLAIDQHVSCTRKVRLKNNSWSYGRTFFLAENWSRVVYIHSPNNSQCLYTMVSRPKSSWAFSHQESLHWYLLCHVSGLHQRALTNEVPNWWMINVNYHIGSHQVWYEFIKCEYHN